MFNFSGITSNVNNNGDNLLDNDHQHNINNWIYRQHNINRQHIR